MSQPQIPPRPARSQAPQGTTSTTAAPVVPPRPAGRRNDRSESPQTHYPRSPLNDSPFPVDHSNDLQRVASLNASKSNLDLPARPPSVTFPTVGAEGIEYDARSQDEEQAVDDLSDMPGISPTHTRKVSSDLPLHAPRPSLSSSEAKQRVAAVVRTDSNQNVSVLSQKSSQPSLKPKPSFQRPGSSGSHHERPGSSYEDEHGIPRIGQHVPLGYQYGDVQAPSPAPGSPSTPGFDVSSRPSTGKHHSRKHSGRNDFHAPPGSYGLHGHGVHDTSDPFEKDWLQKHPEALREEIAAHSPAILDRHDYNLTPAELNKLVKQNRSSGFATSGAVGMPDEQIGYQVSEKYSHGVVAGTENTKPATAHAPHVDSPLKRGSITAEDLAKAGPLGGSTGGTVHVDAPAHKESKHLGRGQAAAQEHEDLGPQGGNTDQAGGWHDESGYGVPILASDEVDPEKSYLQPAVPPEARRPSQQYDEFGHSRPSSRPSSRPGSIHNVPAGRPLAHTQLEGVREYEPLFPEDDKPGKKPSTPAERFKQRPDMKQRFPSQDIWEDAPASVMMSAEVETPEEEPVATKPGFESPEAERARKGEVSESDRSQLLPREVRLAQSSFQPHLKQEIRPGMNKQRFPSRDIWEDSPDSVYMTTTVGDGQDDGKNLADEAGAVVSTTGNLPREGATAGASAVPLPTDIANRPEVPQRPNRAVSPGKMAPQVPARPARRPSPQADKPSVPARPAKASQVSADDAPTESGAEPAGSSRSVESATSAKQKPTVPARMGNKIAALQAGFMSDLNKKLGLGPHGPPKKEETEEQTEEEKKPLEDARKSRARGPARRKPAASPSGAAATSQQTQPRQFVVTPVYNLYDISPSGELTATHAETWAEKLKFKDGLEDAAKDVASPSDAPIAQAVPPAAGFNTAGEAVHPPTVTPEAVRSTAQTESAPALAGESELSAEPDDTGHAGVSQSLGVNTTAASGATAASSVQSPSIPLEGKSQTANRQEIKTGVQDPVEEPSEHLKKTRTSSSSAGTQTGEMQITLDKSSSNPQTLTAYKNGSAHEEGYAFVKDDEKAKDAQ